MMYAIDLDAATLDDVIEQADRWGVPAESLDSYQDLLDELEMDVIA